MLKWLTCWLTFGVVLASESPFWKAKPKVYERIENQEVVVGVNSGKNLRSPPQFAFHAAGGGQVHAPCDFVFKIMQEYDKLTLVSDYIKSAKYDAAKNLLDLRIEAFGHGADFRVELTPVDKAPRRLGYKIVSGPMPGMTGQLELTSLPKFKCEIGFSGDYQYDEFPIPKLFLDFGMEVIFQRMALRMRSYVEDRYKANVSK